MKLIRFVAPAVLAGMISSAGISVAQNYYGPPPPPPGYGHYDRWDEAPAEFREVQRRGFSDGVEGARKDFQNHRRPDVENRDEYRNPKFIAPPDRHDYREGFRRGYDVGVQHIYGRG
jgi:hypothetical protein